MSENKITGEPSALPGVAAAMPAIAGAGSVEQIVAGKKGGLVLRDQGGGERTFRKAVSCLVTPQVNDRVLTAGIGGQTYVLAILEREAGETLKIESSGALEFSAKRIAFKTGFLDILAETVTMAGNAIHSLFRRSRRIVGHDETMANSSSLKANDRAVVIAQADVSHAGLVSQKVDGPLAVKSRTAILSSDGDIRLNGERVNVG
ncbi:DUF3540 domain-containing protein [Roseibium marinum]|uniref:Uncharacterized protein DUF3540 n=1 Tax=Roseibium marinum TaxID=281252 RepID=A0A2S3V1C6_9HYPH|nr:DUF3540 domain-containing protein [Roseibium marinum]POF33774.1 uncharacterized protein DUF3540 [Roseibium marinum]